MREFIVLAVLTLVFVLSCIYLFCLDLNAFSRHIEEDTMTFEPMDEETVAKQMQIFSESLDKWSVVSDKMNYE